MKSNRFVTYLFILTSMLVLSTGCLDSEDSDIVKQDRIFTEFELFYNANSDKTFARAVFRVGNSLGTLLELSDGSTVTFEGEQLTPTTEPVTNFLFYEKEYAGFIEKGNFTWTDTDGNSITNTVTINPINYPSTLPDIDRTQSYELTWDGAALGVDEVVNVTLDGGNVFDARIFTQNDVGSQSIILGKNQLTQLPAGNANMLMDRVFHPEMVQSTDAGGKLTGRYRPANVVVGVQ